MQVVILLNHPLLSKSRESTTLFHHPTHTCSPHILDILSSILTVQAVTTGCCSFVTKQTDSLQAHRKKQHQVKCMMEQLLLHHFVVSSELELKLIQTFVHVTRPSCPSPSLAPSRPNQSLESLTCSCLSLDPPGRRGC